MCRTYFTIIKLIQFLFFDFRIKKYLLSDRKFFKKELVIRSSRSYFYFIHNVVQLSDLVGVVHGLNFKLSSPMQRPRVSYIQVYTVMDCYIVGRFFLSHSLSFSFRRFFFRSFLFCILLFHDHINLNSRLKYFRVARYIILKRNRPFEEKRTKKRE